MGLARFKARARTHSHPRALDLHPVTLPSSLARSPPRVGGWVGGCTYVCLSRLPLTPPPPPLFPACAPISPFGMQVGTAVPTYWKEGREYVMGGRQGGAGGAGISAGGFEKGDLVVLRRSSGMERV